MNNLFKEIIIGEKELKELELQNPGTSNKVKNNNEIAKYFIKTVKRKYNDDKITRKDINKLLEIYNDLLNENKTIKKYLRSKQDEDLLKDSEHIIKLFVDDYVKSIENKVSIWNREIRVAGFVEPLLFSLITIFVGIIFLGNLYLFLY